jgi:hypothetical protein
MHGTTKNTLKGLENRQALTVFYLSITPNLTTTAKQTNMTATPNHSKRTFTIRKDESKYRTLPMTKQEFNEALYFTSDDWKHWLRTSQSYKAI